MQWRSGWAVPEKDRHCFFAVLSEAPDLGASLDLCKEFRTAIQAGGNIGIYPAALAQRFTRVYTVEPDAANFAALQINTSNQQKIIARRAAFGKERGRAAIDQIQQGDEFEVITIDSLGVTDCDLLQLDVEGSEHEALLGAIATIEASWPVITLELKTLGERYGYTDADTINLLAGMGYEIADRVNRDVIFIHG